MNAWLLAAAVLCAGGFAPCVWLGVRGPAHHRLAGVNPAAPILAVVFLLLSKGLTRSSYEDLALVLAVLAPAGTLVFTRLLIAEGR